jgi:hypothetical protein
MLQYHQSELSRVSWTVGTVSLPEIEFLALQVVE